MSRKISELEYTELAELRYCIRQFLRRSDEAAQAAGLEPQQYQMLVVLRAVRRGQMPSIRYLADRMLLRHHSAVGLIDRLQARGYVRRRRNPRDERGVLVQLLPRGRHALERVVRNRLRELRDSGDSLAETITALLKENREKRLVARKPGHLPRRARQKRSVPAIERS